ncbi:hypothetical protein JHK87_055926 [Glycine soja]|nr:hypothetical protein JHK87_055926 [Glycine soja]
MGRWAFGRRHCQCFGHRDAEGEEKEEVEDADDIQIDVEDGDVRGSTENAGDDGIVIDDVTDILKFDMENLSMDDLRRLDLS